MALRLSASHVASLQSGSPARQNVWAVGATVAVLLSVLAVDAKRKADAPRWITASDTAVVAERQADDPQPVPITQVPVAQQVAQAAAAPDPQAMVPIQTAVPTLTPQPMPRLIAGEPGADAASDPQVTPAGAPAGVAAGGPAGAAMPTTPAAAAGAGVRLIDHGWEKGDHLGPAASPSSAAAGNVPRSTLAAGQRGLDEALRGGLLRQAGADDLSRWNAARERGDANADALRLPATLGGRVFVIQQGFQWPEGMRSVAPAVFLLEPGVPYPAGDAGATAVLDLASGACRGALCQSLGRAPAI